MSESVTAHDGPENWEILVCVNTISVDQMTFDASDMKCSTLAWYHNDWGVRSEEQIESAQSGKYTTVLQSSFDLRRVYYIVMYMQPQFCYVAFANDALPIYSTMYSILACVLSVVGSYSSMLFKPWTIINLFMNGSFG